MDMPSSKRVRTNQDFNNAAVIEATGFSSPERCPRCTLNNSSCIVLVTSIDVLNALHEAVTAVRAEDITMPLNWVQFVHYGA